MANLTNQQIKDTYQYLLQVDSGVVQNGLGNSNITLDLSNATVLGTIESSSYSNVAQTAITASIAITASVALSAPSSSFSLTSSFSETASIAETASVALTAQTASYLLGSVESASYAAYAVTASYLSGSVTSASYANTATTASYSLTASYLLGSVESASYADTAVTASYSLTAVSSSYVLTASYVLGGESASYAKTASFLNPLTQSVSLLGDMNISGTLTVTTINAVYVTSSNDFITGSSKFGDQLTDTHQFTGSVSIDGTLNAQNITGSLLGTSSFALNTNTALTASYVDITGSGVIVNYNGSQIQLTGSSASTDTLQDVTTRGNSTSASVFINTTDPGVGYVIFNSFESNFTKIEGTFGTYSSSFLLTPDDAAIGGAGLGSRINISADIVDIKNVWITGSITSAETASVAILAQTASYVDITGSGISVNYGTDGQIQLTGSSANVFPYTGSAVITGSLQTQGPITGSALVIGDGATNGSFRLVISSSSLIVEKLVSGTWIFSGEFN